jgi:hypothetical protein
MRVKKFEKPKNEIWFEDLENFAPVRALGHVQYF